MNINLLHPQWKNLKDRFKAHICCRVEFWNNGKSILNDDPKKKGMGEGETIICECMEPKPSLYILPITKIIAVLDKRVFLPFICLLVC